MIKGIDVSDNNGRIDWAAVKAAGVQFAILRIGYGDDVASQDDIRFEENVAGCEQNGIPWGAYIYSYAMSINEAKSEVSHCLRRLSGKKSTYPICFDMEDADGYKKNRGGLSKEMAVSICETFLDGMENNGYYASLYASLSWFNGILNDSRLDRFDKWVAQWNTVCEYHKEYGMWQYGGSTNYIESPYVNGINGAVDKNYAYKDYPTLIKENQLNGWGYNISGWIDGADKNGCNGWCYNGVNDTPVNVHIYAYKNGSESGTFIGAADADKYREDLVNAGVGNGYHAYSATYNLCELGEGVYTIRAYGVIGENNKQLKGECYVTINAEDLIPSAPPEETTPPPTDEPKPDTNTTTDNTETDDTTGAGILATIAKLIRQIINWAFGRGNEDE